MADLIIRNGSVVDGTGAAPRYADVAITGGRITEIGEAIDGRGNREIDADGMIVTPGFVDIHTHFDGQATWDADLAPSSNHGVTSIVMGNCGVGFAPARPTEAEHNWLIGLLEGVEDIPGTALAEGLPWDWETFPEYLDSLGRRSYVVDVGTQVAHAPLRAYVMGERGADHEESPSVDELTTMARLTREAIDAGALGFTTSRTYIHRTTAGKFLGTRFSSADELHALVGTLGEARTGVIQLISDAYQSTDEDYVDAELALMRSLVEVSGRPLSTTVQQPFATPDRWRKIFSVLGNAQQAGLSMRAQIAPRPIGVLHGLEASVNPFILCPGYREIAMLPTAERVRAMADPDRRARIIAEHEALGARDGILNDLVHGLANLFPMSDPVDYEPAPEHSIARRGAAAGVSAVAFLYDTLLEDDGRRLLYMPLFNYVAGDLSEVREMLGSPVAMIGLSDAGAHCGAICDASFPTTALGLWTHRRRGEGLPVEAMVHHLTQRTAAHVGWHDRGVLAVGRVADVNVIDLDALSAAPPRIVKDLPAGGRRLNQSSTGYRATIKSGVVTFEDGVPTGAHPGRLVRGPQPASL